MLGGAWGVVCVCCVVCVGVGVVWCVAFCVWCGVVCVVCVCVDVVWCEVHCVWCRGVWRVLVLFVVIDVVCGAWCVVRGV